MRRVDEAVREVLSDAIAQDLKDPRVGFVTVTAVKTSPTCAMPASTSASSATTRRAGARSTGLRSAHGFLQRRVARELRLKHTPDARRSLYDDTTDRGMRVSSSSLEPARTDGVTADNGSASRPRADRSASSAAPSASCSSRTRTPTATRSARSSAMQQRPHARSARTRVMFMGARRVPAALRVPLLRARRAS